MEIFVILSRLNNSCKTASNLDFQKAFDSVPHQRLIQKLTSFGINGKILQWINDFLWNRTQQVLLNGQKSSTTCVTSGVPKGSVLGPVLFTLFVNDIPSMVSSPTFMFADDTKIFRCVGSNDDHSALQNDLNLLYEWSVRWQLNFNISKCKHIHLGPIHGYGPYYLNGGASFLIISLGFTTTPQPSLLKLIIYLD